MRSLLQPSYIAVAFSPTGERVRCVTRPNNGWEGDYSMQGTNAVYFCSQIQATEKTDNKIPVLV